MPFFKYLATDASGRPQEGTISAASAEAAREALQRGGYRVSSIGPSVAAAPVAPSRSRTVAPPPSRPTAAPRAVAVAPAAPVPAQNTVSTTPVVNKTPPGRYRDLYFLFGQISSLNNAGVTPAQIFQTLSQRASTRYTASLKEMASGTAESHRISGVMERYPYLYPPSAIGMMKAGEAAGFMPAAADRISEQNYSIHRLHRRLGWLLGYACLMLFLSQAIYGVVVGALNSIREQNQADGRLPVAETLMKHLTPQFARNVPLGLAWIAIFLILYYLWNTMPLRMVRHQLVLGIPLLRQRAKAEAIASFSWAAGMLARGGLSAQNAYLLAAESIPNLVIRQQMMDAGKTMAENESMSAVIRRSRVLPADYGHVIETGEITGTVPDALGQIARNAESEFAAKDKVAGVAMTGMIIFLMSGVVVVILAALYRLYITGILDIMTQDPT